jgi:replication factor C small subunit
MTNPFQNLFVEKYRPATLDDIVLSKEDREFFESLATKQEIPHLLFAGPAGVGKSTTAKAIINDVLGGPNFLYINSSDESGIDTIRSRVVSFAQTKSFDGRMKVILLEEICGLSGPAQDALRNTIEEYSSNNRFIMTCNYLHKITKPIQSRCQIINLNPPLEGIVARIVSILKSENITIPEDQKPLLLKHIKANLPDLRRIINDVQKFTISGTLQIRHDASTEFADNLFKKIINKEDLTKIRKEVIENEKAFSNDYRSLLKQLFEVIFASELPYETKINQLLIVSKGLETDCMIVDKEINFFTTVINLARSNGV